MIKGETNNTKLHSIIKEIIPISSPTIITSSVISTIREIVILLKQLINLFHT